MSIDLLDSFGRKHDYLRLSITDSCNFRCLYCMPDEPFSCSSIAELMSAEEIFNISKVFVEKFGIKKIRITGGEPLVRQDFKQIIELLSQLNVQIAITTNGVLLDRYFSLLEEKNIRDINISIDSLNRQKFKLLTKRDSLPKVWENILTGISKGFNIKLNAVIIDGMNTDDILPLAELSHRYPIEMRFIEFMPFNGNSWERNKVFPIRKMLSIIGKKYDYLKLFDAKNDTSKKYKLRIDSEGSFGFISTMTDSFCAGCNRIRLTSDGKMKNCLFGAEEFDLLSLYRQGQSIENAIKEGIWRKHKEKGGQFIHLQNIEEEKLANRSMIKIGG